MYRSPLATCNSPHRQWGASFGHRTCSLCLHWRKLSYFGIFDVEGLKAYRSKEMLPDASCSPLLLCKVQTKVPTCSIPPLMEVNASFASEDEFSVTQWRSGSHLTGRQSQVEVEPSLCGVCMFYLHLCGFSQDSPASSHSLKSMQPECKLWIGRKWLRVVVCLLMWLCDNPPLTQR